MPKTAPNHVELEAWFSFRLPVDDKTKAIAAADAAGLPISAWFRVLVKRELARLEKAERVAAPPKTRRA
jgi:hypothetical protein